MKKVIYIAGPMRGIPEFNYPAFVSVAKFLRSEGWEVRSPVEIGALFGKPEDIQRDEGLLQAVQNAETFCIIDECDAIYLLPGWEASVGAKCELYYAIGADLEVILHYDYMANGHKYTPEKPEVKA